MEKNYFKTVFKILNAVFFVAFMALFSTISAQIIQFSDANFKAKLLLSSPNYSIAQDLNGNYFKIDANNDGEIEIAEALQVSRLFIYHTPNQPITNIQEVSYFLNVSSLKLQSLDITTLNISSLNFLKNLELTSLSKTPTLSLPASIENLQVEYCAIINNTNIGNLANLKTLYLTDATTNITALDLSNFKLLEDFYCSNYSNPNKLTELNASNLPLLTSLVCSYNSLTTLNITGTNNLKKLELYNNKLTSLDISQQVGLENLNCSNNELTTLDVSKIINNPENTSTINCDNNKLQSLDLKNLTLGYVNASNNLLTNVNFENANFIWGMDFQENKLTILDLSKYGLETENSPEMISFSNNNLQKCS